jgi:hypothetical protein
MREGGTESSISQYPISTPVAGPALLGNIEEAFDFQFCFLASPSWIFCHLLDFGRILCVCLDYHEGAMPICGRHFNRDSNRWWFFLSRYLSSISWLLGFLLYGSFFLAAVFPDYSTLPPAQTAGLWSPVVSFSF